MSDATFNAGKRSSAHSNNLTDAMFRTTVLAIDRRPAHDNRNVAEFGAASGSAICRSERELQTSVFRRQFQMHFGDLVQVA
ncbi:hypothetical protein EAG_04134 [Camponotus floridanus]|uniref:Uncharacterized protein n=1 Tax=Camponotus floridanus TaxID=104421 RepID=E2A2T7_CAMFO|nr:hypothetical protein EAG_04134 [Camponotus floridanus]